jgi:predicted DNA-binding transcriptional regulator YafY
VKIDRLIGIITLLLQNDKMTAPELAEKFNVSRRTINRDINDICMAGIPIVTTQGVNGGISIMDGYKIDKVLFTDKDLEAIFTGLLSLSSISLDRRYQNITDKFASSNHPVYAKNRFLINLSSHYKSTLAPKINLLEKCIEDCTCISFIYYNQKGEREVTIDPYLVVFEWSSWYILGFDHATQQFKLYKLNRIGHISKTNKSFIPQNIPEEMLCFDNYFSDEIHAIILFEKSEKYRLIDEYGINSFSETEDGKLLFSFPFTNEDYLLSWVLSFGDKAKLLEPEQLRDILQVRLENALKQYSNGDI